MTIRQVETGLTQEVTVNSANGSGGTPWGYEVTGGIAAGWGVREGSGGPSPVGDAGAEADLQSRITNGYNQNLHSDYGVDWMSTGASGPAGVDPVNAVTSYDTGGFNGSKQQGEATSEGLLPFGGDLLTYSVDVAVASFNLQHYLVDDPYNYWRYNLGYHWEPSNYPPYNDYPYGLVDKTGTIPTLLGGRLHVEPMVNVDSPPCGIGIYAGDIGSVGKAWSTTFAAMQYLGGGDPSTGFDLDLTAGQILGGMVGDELVIYFPLEYTVADNFPTLSAPGSYEWGWYWSYDTYIYACTLELDFQSPTFLAAKYADQLAPVTVRVCDAFIFGDSVSTG